MAGADTDFEGFSWLWGVDPALSQHASVKEGIAGTIGEFDEAESLLSTEPFDDPTDRWAGRGLEPRLCESGSGAKSTRLWAVGIGVEVSTPRVTEILMSHFGSWKVWCPDQFERANDGMPSRLTAGIGAGRL